MPLVDALQARVDGMLPPAKAGPVGNSRWQRCRRRGSGGIRLRYPFPEPGRELVVVERLLDGPFGSC